MVSYLLFAAIAWLAWGTCSVLVNSATFADPLEMYVDELPKMPKIIAYEQGSKGRPRPIDRIHIGMYATTWKFHRDLPETPVFAYGTSEATASVPGPSIVAHRGVPVYVRWTNHLPTNHILPWDPTLLPTVPRQGGVPTVVHVHGGLQHPTSDGHPLAWFTANFRETGPRWSQENYTYPNVAPPGNLWYHDHAMGITRINVLAGLLGLYTIVEPCFENRLNLPSGPEYDRHIVVFDRNMRTNGSIYVNSTGVFPELHPQWQPEYYGDVMLVNGKAWPFLDVYRRRYRFRILNACNARYLGLSLSNGLQFQVIGSDGSYLNRPVQTSRILLGPAEGADVVVDFSQSGTSSAELRNDAAYPYPGGEAVGPLTGNIMKFNILPDEVPDKTRVPRRITNYQEARLSDATFTRYISLNEYSIDNKITHLDINGLDFLDPVTETPRRGSTEIWYVINLTEDNHPLHIHLASSQAIRVQEIKDLDTFRACMLSERDANRCNVTGHVTGNVLPIPEHERVWKNIIKIEPGYMTTVLVEFRIADTKRNYPFDATAEPGYIYHCHMLEHEDNVMMRPLKVLPLRWREE